MLNPTNPTNPHSDLPLWFADANPLKNTAVTNGAGLWLLDVGPKVVRPYLNLPAFINADGSFRLWLGTKLPCTTWEPCPGYPRGTPLAAHGRRIEGEA